MKKTISYISSVVLLTAIAPSLAAKVSPHMKIAGQPQAERDPSIPPGWILFPRPAINSDEMECAQRSQREWIVYLEDSHVNIDRTEQETNCLADLPFEIAAHFDLDPRFLAGRCRVHPVSDGWLVAFEAGEWGGALYWFSHAGERKRKIVDGAIVGLGFLSDTIVAFRTNLRHNAKSEAFKIVKQGSAWEAVKFAQIPLDPRLIVVENRNSILVLTSDSLSRLHASGKMDSLLQTHFDYLYPNSMVLTHSGVLYIGMRHFVGRLVPNGNGWLEQWLVPEDCARFELDESTGDCICVSKERKY